MSLNINFPCIKGASYILVNAPDMVINCGTTQTLERETNPNSEYLKDIRSHLRKFDDVVSYIPNQVYIGNMDLDELSKTPRPWYTKNKENSSRWGSFGEIMPQDEFYGLMKISDSFDIVMLEESFCSKLEVKLSKHPLLKDKIDKIGNGYGIDEIKKNIEHQGAEGLTMNGELVGCVKRAHEFDKNLSAHIMIENLAVKASGALALINLIEKSNIAPDDIGYIIECSEEAIGDMNQRGGGNIAKGVGEIAGCINATGIDMRGFCAGPSHALINAASLVSSGIFKNVVVLGGGSTAKLGMNGKDHLKKNMPIIEDVLGGFAVLISENDGVNPILRTDIIGKHKIGSGSSPQAVMEALVSTPLEKAGYKITDVDKYSPEMQNPECTEPAGAGDVPTANLKMIGALGVKKGQIERSKLLDFVAGHGYPGFAPTQGHVPSGVPIIGFGRKYILEGKLNNFMIIGKGSLFLGRMTNLFDGISILIEKNKVLESTNNKVRVGLTILGSEHGVDEVINGAKIAKKKYNDFDTVLIGKKVEGFESYEAETLEESHKLMEKLLDEKKIDCAVTLHYNFPIGVSTVGRVISPSSGRDFFIATSTGTSATDRTTAMYKNAIYGIIVAKAMGCSDPSIGILNIDGARQAERALKELNTNGYNINFAESKREDGGVLMRGNDILMGTPDVLITDTLTGNILVKMLSSYVAGGDYESIGYGYGPGIGEDLNKIICIVSRASGSPVICEALKYAATLYENDLIGVMNKEFEKVKKFSKPLEDTKASNKINMPPKKVVTYQIPGIDILELDDAQIKLIDAGIYCESGMGCTGPIILVAEDEGDKAREILAKGGYIE